MLSFHQMLQEYCHLIEEDELEKIEIAASGLSVCLPNGLRFSWRPGDLRNAISHIVNGVAYEADERHMLFSMANRSKTIFDVGANVGWYAIHFGQLMARNSGHVYCFEPVLDTFDILTENVKMNALANVHSHNVAFGDSRSSEDFFVPEFSGSAAASMRPLFPAANRKVTCQVVSIDEFVAEREVEKIDFLKCDVEGSELLVMRGGVQTLERDRPVIFVEMLRKWTAKFEYHPNDTIQLLADLGYSCFYNEQNKLSSMPFMSEECEETNFYFLNPQEHESIIKRLTR